MERITPVSLAQGMDGVGMEFNTPDRFSHSGQVKDEERDKAVSDPPGWGLGVQLSGVCFWVCGVLFKPWWYRASIVYPFTLIMYQYLILNTLITSVLNSSLMQSDAVWEQSICLWESSICFTSMILWTPSANRLVQIHTFSWHKNHCWHSF